MSIYYNNETNTKYKVNNCSNVIRTYPNCGGSQKVNFNNIKNTTPITTQELPYVPNYEICDPNRVSDNAKHDTTINNYATVNIYDISPKKLQQMRAYRNYLNSQKNSAKCKINLRNKMKNRYYVNDVYKQSYYELELTTGSGKTYRLYKKINGCYRKCGCTFVSNNETLQEITGRNKPKIMTKETVSHYEGNIAIMNKYKYFNGAWNLC